MKTETNKWLVTVAGSNAYCTPQNTMITVTIDLKEGMTPIDWFLTKPKVYNRFEFTPSALINFWKLEIDKKKTSYIN